MNHDAHWEGLYRQKRATEVSWYRDHLHRSLDLIATCNPAASARIVDMGGGASTLVDDLLERGHSDVTVIDLAASALEQARNRLGERAGTVRWIRGDATTPLLETASVDLWHDRAVFHFLTDGARRDAYIVQMARSVRPGGCVVIGTFAPGGPDRCSGLPVTRYTPRQIADTLGNAFETIAEARETHHTPWDAPQPFSYVLCRRRPRR